MGTIPKNVLREIIKENDFKNPGEIYAYLKDAFKDLLQEMLEAEMDVYLGYDKNDVKNKQTDNYRNGHSQKTVKSQYGEVDRVYHVIGKVNLNLKLFQSISVIFPKLRRR